jgi:hypothetical protein
MSALEDSLAKELCSTLLTFGASHAHIAKFVHILFKHTVKSIIENGVFILYEWKKDTWTRLPHNDLFLNPIREKLAPYFDKARSHLPIPKSMDCEYHKKFNNWQKKSLEFMTIQESLYNHTFMKCILDEVILLFYTSDPL